MWPWAHAALAYLLYTAYRHGRGTGPGEWGAVTVVVGALVPDLVDKPLAWTVQVLPHGRSLMHSAITATALTIALVWVARDRDHAGAAYAFAAGVWTHILADGLPTYDHVDYLLWPVLEPHPAEIEPSFIAHFTAIEPTPWFLAQLAITGLAVVAWFRDGRPGGTVLRHRLNRFGE